MRGRAVWVAGLRQRVGRQGLAGGAWWGDLGAGPGVPGGVAEFEGQLGPVVGWGGFSLDGLGVNGLCGSVVCASHGGSVVRLVGRLNLKVGGMWGRAGGLRTDVVGGR